MKLYLIKASAEGYFKAYKNERGGPPQNIFSAAAKLHPEHDVEMTDETAGMTVNFKTDADIVIIFMATPDAIRGYNLAKKFKQAGKTVLLGGLHVTFMHKEAIEYCDAVIVGESEGVLDDIIQDFRYRRLKAVYKSENRTDLCTLQPFPAHSISPDNYRGFWTILVSRGCSHHCEFCLVRPFMGKQRYRPIKDVVDEIKYCGAKWVELHADNLTKDKEYCLELFKALKPLNVYWATTTSITFAEDEDFLKAAAESGLKYVLVGLETPSESALKATGKSFLTRERVKKCIQALHRWKITVDSCVLFGFDEHDTSIFKETLSFVNDVKVDICQPAIITPFPGSRLYTRLEEEARILTRDWAKYDCSHAVFQPAKMTPEQLENGALWFYKRHNLSFRSIIKSIMS